MSIPHCVWCNGAGGALVTVTVPMVDRFGAGLAEQSFSVHSEHEEPFRKFAGVVVRSGRAFIVGVLVITLLMMGIAFVSVLLDSRRVAILGIGACTVLLALGLLKWPFATPETVAVVGVKRAIAIVRVLACGLLGLGVALIVLLR